MTGREEHPVEQDETTWNVWKRLLRESIAIYRDVLPVLLAALGGGIVAGSILGGEEMRSAFETVPGLLLMLPAVLDLRGNIYGAMGARIATGLHQGLIEPEYTWQERLETVFAAAFINSIVISTFIAVSSYAVLSLLGMPAAPFLQLLTILLIAGVLNAVTLSGVLILLLFAGYNRGYDPAILNGPIVTTAGDIFGVTFLYIAVILVGVVL